MTSPARRARTDSSAGYLPARHRRSLWLASPRLGLYLLRQRHPMRPQSGLERLHPFLELHRPRVPEGRRFRQAVGPCMGTASLAMRRMVELSVRTALRNGSEQLRRDGSHTP
jgi:hypothetical protein